MRRRRRMSLTFLLVCAVFSISMTYMTYVRYTINVSDEEDLHFLDYEAASSDQRPININSHQHEAESNEFATKLFNEVRVLCWIMTSPSNLEKKATAVKTTWAKRCNRFVFISSETNSSFPTIGLNVSEGRNHLTAKTMQGFLYMFQHYYDEADWFLKADDDTYIIVENLRFFLSHQKPSHPVYFGHHFKTIVKQGYMSGGAGYVLSKEALRRVVTIGLKDPKVCRRDGGAEDAEIGKCLMNVGVKPGLSLDSKRRETFHPFKPMNHLRGAYPDWYKRYSYHPIKKGPDAISDYAITFHYVTPDDMYLMDYFLYHIRPVGVVPVIPKDAFNEEPTIQTDKIA